MEFAFTQAVGARCTVPLQGRRRCPEGAAFPARSRGKSV